MRKIGFITSMALAVFFASCDKDDVNPNEPQPEGSRIKKVEYSSNEYTSFVYNPDNTISKMIFADGSEINNANFTYANGKLGEIQTDDGLAYQLKYQNGKASVVDVLEDGTGKISFNELVVLYFQRLSAAGYHVQYDNQSCNFPSFLQDHL